MSDAAPPARRASSDNALPPGTRLGEFEIRHVLGIGGFGIVYLAFDHDLEREVAVKEYMPASLAGRTETLHVTVRSKSDEESFALGLRSFVNEARLLARFDHASLLKVLRFWEANGTAYMAMPVLRGRTLREVRLSLSAPPSESWLRTLMEPLLGAIETLHSAGVYHRDIAPDNIQIEPDGRPVLLDFGAARRVLNDKTQTLTAILKPAYAPIEQYAESGAVKQGPWTDIYAFGATLHFVLLGRPPAPATTRAVHDGESALTPEAVPGVDVELLRAVDWMLAPRPQDRPQSVAALREVLAGRAAAPRRRQAESQSDAGWESTVRVAAPDLDEEDQTRVEVPRAAQPNARPATSAGRAAPVPPAPAPSSVPARSGRWLPAAAGVAALAVVGAAAVFFWPRPPAPPLASATTPPVAAEPAAPIAIPTPAVVPPTTVGVAAEAGSAATAMAPSTPSLTPPAGAAPGPAAAAVPESTVAHVVVPGVVPTPKRESAASTRSGAATRPAQSVPPPPAVKVAAQPAPPVETSAARPETPPAAAVVASTAPPAPAPEPANPGAECRKIPKHQIAYVTCMTKLCRSLPALADCQAFYRNAHAD
jgi:serine/threonine protein kinase